jgi:crotonobetainyl-CoA:carnitine CoA-transferase CaiB-like acyl-CoA transferase
MSAPYQAVRRADGYITVGAANDRVFARLAALLGHAEWVEDPRFATDGQRVAHREALASAIEEVMAGGTCRAWLARLEAGGVPCGPINDYRAVFDDVQVRAREMVNDVEHPTLGRIRALGTPIKMSETPLNPRRRAPLLGEHTREVLRAAGVDDEEIERLCAAAVVRAS